MALTAVSVLWKCCTALFGQAVFASLRPQICFASAPQYSQPSNPPGLAHVSLRKLVYLVMYDSGYLSLSILCSRGIPPRKVSVEQMWRLEDSHGQILALAFR